MTLTELEKDIQTLSFNYGQATLIENILSTNYKDLEELKMMLRAWLNKLDQDIDKLDEKYEVEEWSNTKKYQAVTEYEV